MSSTPYKIRSMKRRSAGFTLVELMVAITIAAILIAIAAPNFTDTVRANRVQSQLSDLRGDLNFARSDAVSRGRYVTLCPSNDNYQSCSGNWGDGWFIFIESDKKVNVGTYESGDTIVRKHPGLSGNTLRVVDNSAPAVAQSHITFFNSGHVSEPNPLTLWLCDAGKNVKFARALLKVGAGQFLYSNQDASGIYKDVKDGALTCP